MQIVKTILLLSLLTVILITLGGFVGGRDGIMMAFFFSLFLNAGMYFFSDKLALSASGAKPLPKSENPEIYKTVHDLAKQMGIPMPKIYITPSEQANAFATGRSPKNASIAVTNGILKTLSKEELRGVLAHELAHVKNRDILIASIAAVLASSISFISNMALFGGGNDDNRSSAGLGIIIALLVPIAAAVLQFAISRQREFSADETGAKIIGDGEPLASALLEIQKSTQRNSLKTNPAFSSLYIENPLGSKRSMMQLFSTHPPVEERVKRLRKI